MNVRFDIEGLNTLFKSFHNISGVKIGVYLPDGTPLAAHGGNDCAFCQLVRQNENFLCKCHEDDKRAFELALQGKTEIYRCHAGLYESVAPIMYENKPVACLMIGQIAPEMTDDIIDAELSQRLTGHEQLKEIISEFKKMPQRTDEYLASSVNIMAACAGYIYLKKLVSLENSSLSEQLADYIEDHYQDNITLKSMAKALGVSVTKLCTDIRAEIDTTPHALLDNYRIKKAQDLLKTTKLPISIIAAKVGMPDYNYFSRIFKKRTGKTPSQYRKEHAD